MMSFRGVDLCCGLAVWSDDTPAMMCLNRDLPALFPLMEELGMNWKLAAGGTPPIPYCQKEHIENTSDYLAAYGDRLNRCGFALGVSADKDQSAFETTLQLQDYNIRKKLVYPYNEVLIKGWDKYAPERIPLLGFFYVDVKSKLTPSGDIYIVQQNQIDYYKKTHLFAPVIRISGDSWMKISFTYVKSDQSATIPDITDVIIDKIVWPTYPIVINDARWT